jgi:hypothetical protein
VLVTTPKPAVLPLTSKLYVTTAAETVGGWQKRPAAKTADERMRREQTYLEVIRTVSRMRVLNAATLGAVAWGRLRGRSYRNLNYQTRIGDQEKTVKKPKNEKLSQT